MFGVLLQLIVLVVDAANVPAGTFTFHRDVLPILQKHCQSCHRPGEAAPMSLLTYESTRPWAKAIKVAVISGKMPPWPPDPRFGRFLHERTLTPQDIQTLVAWVDGGAPEGDPKDQPRPLDWTDGWTTHPDAIVSMPHPIPVPAKGVVELTTVRVPTGFTKDTWVNSMEIRPGNRAVVHHVFVSVVPHDEEAEYGVPTSHTQKRDAAGIAVKKIHADDRLRSLSKADAIYLPGAAVIDYTAHDAAKLIPAGSDLLLQMHYTPNGTATTDQTSVGFTFAKQEPARRFVMVDPSALRDEEHFHIAAGDANWETRTEVLFNQDAELVWFMPHMHLRGKDMTYRLIYPNGQTQTVLSVKFNFNWQMGYDLESPISVPKGTKLEAVAHFDNSANNPLNPNPNTDVWWGEQTWEEMMVPWFGVVIDKNRDAKNVVNYAPEFSGCGIPRGKREKQFCREAEILSLP
jgi:hypothetical protein